MIEQPTAPIPGPMTAGAELGEGRYTLVRLLGTGGMASVWSATDARLHREVAVKIISDTLALDPEFVARFDREARIVAGLSHPHVVQVYDYGAEGARPYLVMEYVSGGTLSAQLKAGRADWNSVTLAREILDALTYIHAAGVLHRDLKPANVLLGLDGRARLTDFGIAHLADATHFTSVGQVLGTQQYLAPEILAGGPATVSTDLYSCGVLLAECAGPAALVEPLRTLIAALTDPVAARRPPSAAAALAMITGPAELPPTVRMSAPTRPMTVTTAVHPGGETGRPRRPAPRTLALVLVGMAVVLAVALTVARGGGGPGPLEVPAPGGSVAHQLDQLDDAVDHARR
jgi:serine/threonine protein kinase